MVGRGAAVTRITVLVLALCASVLVLAALGWWWVLTAPARRAQRARVRAVIQAGNAAEHAWAVPTEGR